MIGVVLGELKHRLAQFNGQAELKPFKPHLTVLGRLLSELPSKPELIDSAIECTEQLIAGIDQRFLLLANDVHDDAA